MAEPVVEQAPAAPQPDAGEIRNDQDAIKAVEALLATPSGEPEETPADDTPTPDEMPADLTSLAERLKATPDKLYALKVPMADGESRTLGELKDGYRTADQLRVEREEAATERSRLAKDRQQALEDLERIARQLPQGQLTPEVVKGLQDARQERLKSELAQLLEAVPDWKDAVRWTAERPVLEAYAGRFGFSPAELAEVVDHRWLRVLRDAALAAEKDKPERVKPPVKVAQAPKPGKQPSQAQEFGRLKAAVTTRRLSPEAAVAQLLKDAGHGR